jgi:hypothetical protein
MFARGGTIVCAAVLALAVAGLVFGDTFRVQKPVDAHGEYDETHTFRGGERACVIVVGDHRPPSPMEIRVFDSKKRLVAETKADTDTACVIWYPPTTAAYRVEIHNLGEEYNALLIYYQGVVKR